MKDVKWIPCRGPSDTFAYDLSDFKLYKDVCLGRFSGTLAMVGDTFDMKTACLTALSDEPDRSKFIDYVENGALGTIVGVGDLMNTIWIHVLVGTKLVWLRPRVVWVLKQ